MAAVFVVGTGIAMIWSAVKYLIVCRALVDSLPPQLPSRFAFPVFALSHSTPLSLQAEYVKSLWGGMRGISLCFPVLFLTWGIDRWLCLAGCFPRKRCSGVQSLEDLQGKLQSGDGPE